MGLFAQLSGFSIVAITAISYTVGTAWSNYHTFDDTGALIVNSEVYNNFPYFQDIRDSSGNPYDYDLNIDYNFSQFGVTAIPGVVEFLGIVGDMLNIVNGFINVIVPTYGTNNFCSEFGEERFIQWALAMDPPLQFWQLFRLSDEQYADLYSRMTNDERLWLGTLELDDYEKYTSQALSYVLHMSEEGYLGISEYAINTRHTTYERCIAYVLSL